MGCTPILTHVSFMVLFKVLSWFDHFLRAKLLHHGCWSISILSTEKYLWINNGRIILLSRIAYRGVNGVNLLLIKVFPFDLFHVVGTQKVWDVSHHVAVFGTDATTASAATLEVESALPLIIISISCLDNIIESTLNRKVLHKIFQKENTSPQSYPGVSVV